jgi:hypothetical protein
MIRFFILLLSFVLFSNSESYKNYNSSRLIFNSDNGDYNYSILPPTSLSSTFSLILPNSYGLNGEFLTSLGNGSLTWSSLSSGSSNPGGGNGNIQFNNSNNFGGEDNLFWSSSSNRVGVGTNNPQFSFDVNGDLLIGNSNTSGTIALYSDQNPDKTLAFTTNSQMTASQTITWPSQDGSAGQLLTNNGSGQLSWSSNATGGSFPCTGQGTGGGSGNTATGEDSFVGGGTGNTADDDAKESAIGGGSGNTIDAEESGIIAGTNNEINVDGRASVIAAGDGNSIRDKESAIGAGANNTIENGAEMSFIGAGANNFIESKECAIVAGNSNTISTSSDQTIIGAGYENYIIDSPMSGIVSGALNVIDTDGEHSSISSGRNNEISANQSFIGSGRYNTVSQNQSSVAGGFSNNVDGTLSAILGGSSNTISDEYSFIFGRDCEVNQNNGLAFGRRAKVENAGATIIADANDQDITSSEDDRMEMRFSGGYLLYSNTALNTGVSLSSGNNSWASISDINKKENIIELNYQSVLSDLATLDIFTWNYKSANDKSLRNYGPMAQDFYKLFGKDKLGKFGTDTTIVSTHPPAIGLAALKGLQELIKNDNLKLSQLKDEQIQIEKEIHEFEQKIIDLELELGQ